MPPFVSGTDCSWFLVILNNFCMWILSIMRWMVSCIGEQWAKHPCPLCFYNVNQIGLLSNSIKSHHVCFVQSLHAVVCGHCVCFVLLQRQKKIRLSHLIATPSSQLTTYNKLPSYSWGILLDCTHPGDFLKIWIFPRGTYWTVLFFLIKFHEFFVYPE